MDVVNVDDVYSGHYLFDGRMAFSPHLSWRSHFARPSLQSRKPLLNIIYRIDYFLYVYFFQYIINILNV